MLKLLGIKQLTPSEEKELKFLFFKKIYNYLPSITFITRYQMKKFEKRCIEENIHKSYEIKVDYKYKNDYNKHPFLIYLTKEKAKENIRALKNGKQYTIKFSGTHFKKVCRAILDNNTRFISVLRSAKKHEGDDNPGLYFAPKSDYWKMKPSKEVKLYKQPTNKTITIGFKKKNKQEFMKKYNIKEKILNYYPKIIYLNEKELNRYLNRIKKNIKVKEKFGQEKLIKHYKGFMLRSVNLYPLTKKQKGFLFYLTKSQINDLTLYRQGGIGYGGKSYIVFSNNELEKTYKEVIKINSQIYSKDNVNPNKPKKLLAITDKQTLLDLTENLQKDLIDFGDEEVKDLIDLDTIIPNSKPTPKDLLMDEELFPKGKKYKALQSEDLIPITTNPSTNGVNILKNILNYPETKRLLGISLSTDLKEKRKNLDSEASFGLASIISSLLTANRGKMSIYSISRNQLKEIIEGFITTLSVLLNPTQKY